MDAANTSVRPQGLSKKIFDDIDEQAARLTVHDQCYEQLSRGSFKGERSKAVLSDKVSVYFEKYNQKLDQWGCIPEDRFTIFFLMDSNAHCKVNGKIFTADDVATVWPGKEYHLLGLPGVHSCALSVNQELLDEFGLAGINLRRLVHSHNSCFAETLRQLARSAITTIEQNVGTPVSGSVSGFGASIAETLVAGIGEVDESMLFTSPRHYLEIVRRARDYIDAHAEEDIRIPRICKEIGISRRALEYGFQNCFEQSPATYLRSVRLNEIRRALKLPENSDRSIGDIAAQWGVWHLSRFAQYYQAQFGELPSETRSKVA